MSTPDQSTKTKIPALAKSLGELCSLKRDNVQRGDYWIITDGYQVSVAQQKLGEVASGMVSVPTDVFLRFVRWYLTGDTDMRRVMTAAEIKAAATAITKAGSK